LMGFNESDTVIFDASQPLPWTIGTVLPRPGEQMAFQSSSWSSDKKQLAGNGILLSDASSFPAVLVYSQESKQYTILKDIIPDLRQSVTRDITVWLNDKRLLLINGGRFYIVDPQAKTARLIYDSSDLYWLSLSSDKRWIYVSRQADEGDIWLATLK
jgi:hypothetical protein